ncbi:glycosyltransferase family 4 protein [Pseudorhizobium marinum]|uniref:glycosyltransferase family 4 protein n=1 Tax=Pseudorhizobium marinum TaxID=1496690 RepID=UPI00068B66A3|nr:glycosyltransferase family 4 protein [Pseudorhizobium marinum]
MMTYTANLWRRQEPSAALAQVLRARRIEAQHPRRLRPLLIAEAANPEWSSVPLVGWNLSRAIARQTNALVVTQIRNRTAFLRAGLAEGEDFIAIDNERVSAALHRFGEHIRGGSNKGWTMVTATSSLAYYSFERELWRALGPRLRAGEFDLVHRITPLSATSQSGIAHHLKRINVPFVIGPLNGGTPWPAAFDAVRRRELEWLTPWRDLHRLMPAYRATRYKAAAVLAGSNAAFQQLSKPVQAKTFWLPENGVDPQRFPFTQRRMRDGVLRVAFVGRLVPYKGADILVEAAARIASDSAIELLIIGEGPEREALDRAVAAQRLNGKVRFLPWQEQAALASALADVHVLALPSVREFGGGVVVEALSLGLVPVVANHGGPPELIDEATGIAVDFTDRESLIAGFAASLRRLASEPGLVERMSAAGGERARRLLTWDAKAERILAIYDWVMGRGTRPEFLNPKLDVHHEIARTN